MIQYVYKPKRRGGDPVRSSENYRGRYRLPGEGRMTDITLRTTDKRTATQLLEKIVRERQQEAAGILAPRLMRESATKPLVEHLSDFLASRRGEGCVSDYVDRIDVRVKLLCQSCEWVLARDVEPEAFVSWRSRHRLAAKTLNHYLDSMNALLNWMRRQGRVLANPLQCVGKVSVQGREKVCRRALTDAEVNRLLSVAGRYRTVYLAALLTGLRRGELRQLVWGDVHLAAPSPFLKVRGATTKNGKDATIWLRDDLAQALRNLPNTRRQPMSRVFRMPKSSRVVEHFAAARVQRVDTQGRRVDFHALRHTFATNLSRGGVTPRVAMELMRHSDMRLTMKTYTDTTQLPTREALDMLPRFEEAAGVIENVGTGTAGAMGPSVTEMRSQNTVAYSRNVSQSVGIEGHAQHDQSALNQAEFRDSSGNGEDCGESPKRVTEGTRTPDPRDHNPML